MKVAAIDVGTNSIHLLVARVTKDNAVEAIDRAKEMVRLGDSVFGTGALSPEHFARGVEAIRRFRTLAESSGSDAVIAVATSAVREAENGGDFVRAIRDETGVELTVIRGDEEARLVYLAARAALELGPRRALIIDIGGGSIELIVGDGRESYFTASLKLGVLRLLQQWPVGERFAADQRSRLAEHLHRSLEPVIADVRKIGFDLVAMTSGTARQVTELIPAPNGSRPRRVPFGEVYALEDRLCSMPTQERAKLPGLEPRRADSIIPGVILMRSLLEMLHVDEYVMCETALREGLVLDYVARNRPGIQLIEEFPDVRRRSVMRLARRCHYDQKHAEQVARLALDLFRGTRSLHALPNSDGELLEFAALLHDIGFHVAEGKHHKHSAYLIENADLQGFSADEVQLLAQVARYHRKATPKETHESYARLPDKLQQRIRALAALLRVADGLDRSYAQRVKSVRSRIGDKVVELTLSAAFDPELEVWGARRKRDLFEEVFGRKLKFVMELSGERPEEASSEGRGEQSEPDQAKGRG